MSSDTEPRARNWRRTTRRALLVLVLLAVGVAAALLIALHSSPTRQALLARMAGAVEEAAGVRATARDFSLDLLGGELVLKDLALAAAEDGARPFLTLPRVRAVVSWPSLVGDRVTVRSLELDSPRLDLGAPLPELEAAPADAPAEDGGRSLDLDAIELTGGTVVSGALPAELETWLESFRVEGLTVRGSYRSERLDLEVAATLGVESPRRPPITATLAVSLAGDPGGSLDLESLELAGDGLRLAARGHADLSAGESAETPRGPARRGPFDLTFDLQAEPGRLFPDLAAAGRFAAAGDLALAGGRLAAALHLDVRQLPGELLATGLAEQGGAVPDLGGTVLDAVADLEVEAALGGPGGPPDRLSGAATLDWRRGEERLAAVELQFSPPAPQGALSLDGGEESPVRLAFDAAVLPAAPGRRDLRGELRAPSWADLAAGELAATTLEIEEPDLAAALDRLGLRPAPDGFQPAGDLGIRVDLRGPLIDPDLRLAAAWRLDGETLAEVEARSIDGRASQAEAAGVHLELAGSLLPAAPGRREIRGELLAADLRDLAREELPGVELVGVRLRLELPDLAAGAEDLRRRGQRLFPERELPALPGELAGALKVVAAVSGPVFRPSSELDAAWWPAAGGSVHLAARGVAGAAAPFFDGEARLEVADLVLDPHLDELHLEARWNGRDLELPRLAGTLASGQRFSGDGRFELAGPALGGELRLEVPRPLDTVERVTASLRLDGCRAPWGAGGENCRAELEVAAGEAGSALARVPLAALRARPELAEILDALAIDGAPGSAPSGAGGESSVWLGLAGLDLDPFLPLLGLPADGPRPRAVFDGSLTLDLADPLASAGTIEISGLVLEAAEGDLEAAAPLRLELRDRRLELMPSRLLGSGPGGAALEVSGSLDLAADSLASGPPEGGLAALVTGLELDLDGSFDSSVLDPFLGGGRATGELALALELRGSPAAPVLAGRIDGSAMTLRYAAPYATRIEGLVAELSARPGGTTLDRLRARWNGGSVELSGRLDRFQGLALAATFRGLRYRLDHGFTVGLGGDLELLAALPGPPAGRALLSGTVVVERGALRRDLAIDRQILGLLLAPDLASVTTAGLLDAVDLDLEVATEEGVRVHNNLADLRADWSPLRLRGTLQNPLVEGRIEVDPGGRITTHGQVVRIDEASITFSGDPGIGPRLVLETTNSLEDPSLKRRGLSSAALGEGGPGAGGYWDRRDDPGSSATGELTEGLTAHYADRLAGSLGRGLERTELGFEPLPIFGETDTQARLTARRRLNPNADLIYSVNPRDAEGQTYVLDLHDFDFAPSFAWQLFTNDDDHQGLTAAQTLALGGGRRREERWPRLAAVRLEAPEGVDRRRLRRALGWRKGDPFPDDAAFDVEIDVIEELTRQGYPGAEAAVAVEPAGRRRELGVTVEPGPRVSFAFEGDTPPRPARRNLVHSYRPAERSVDTASSIEELRRQTARALRGQGYLEPRVEVTVEPAATPADARRVRIHAAGGRKVDPGPPVLEGLAAGEAEILAAQFSSLLSRLELAAGDPGADSYLLRSLENLGYPEARIVSRRLSDDGGRLSVSLEAGPRRHLAAIEIVGVPRDEAARLEELLRLRAGDPARSDLVTRSAHAIEDDLRRRGHAEARVRTSLEPGDADRHRLTLRFAVEPGPLHRLSGVRFAGLRGTRERWAERLAGLEAGEIFRRSDVGEARRRLSRTGLFERLVTVAEPQPGAVGEAATTVTFEVEERPRYAVTYGGRWESDEGAGVVVEAVDQNFLGRGTTLGLRAIYAGDDRRSLRLYHAIPRLRGSRSLLEVFLEGKVELTEDCLLLGGAVEDCRADGLESWVQLTFPLGRRTWHRAYLRYQDQVLRPTESEASDRPLKIPSLGWQLSFDTRARQQDRRGPPVAAGHVDGLVFGLDLSASRNLRGDDFSALGLFSQLKLFRAFGGGEPAGGTGRWAWAQSFRLGLLEPSAGEIPPVSRLRAGGSYSVRGYRNDSLGPVDVRLDAEGGTEVDFLGGEVFLLVNQELHFPLPGERFSGLVFFDAGNVWATRDDLDSELATSLGVGLRASTPAGRLRLDVAFPLDRRPGIDDGVEIYFGFGNIF